MLIEKNGCNGFGNQKCVLLAGLAGIRPSAAGSGLRSVRGCYIKKNFDFLRLPNLILITESVAIRAKKILIEYHTNCDQLLIEKT